MKKLALNLDELRVVSFETGEEKSQRGTVQGRARHTDPAICGITANWYCSVGDGCTWAAYTCAWTCGAECVTAHQRTCDEPCTGTA